MLGIIPENQIENVFKESKQTALYIMKDIIHNTTETIRSEMIKKWYVPFILVYMKMLSEKATWFGNRFHFIVLCYYKQHK